MPCVEEALLRGVWSEPDEGAGCPVQVCPASIILLHLHHPYLKYFLGSPGSGNKTYLFSLILKFTCPQSEILSLAAPLCPHRQESLLPEHPFAVSACHGC